jgi:hypothetical protein
MAFMEFLALVRGYNGYHQIRVIISTEMDRMHPCVHGVVVPKQVIVYHFSCDFEPQFLTGVEHGA